MAITLNKLYVKSFETVVRHLAQQADTRLRPWATERNEAGSTRNWPRMAPQSMTPKSSQQVATPVNNSTWSNRVSTVATYHQGDATDQEDINQLLIDPNSNIANSLAMAAKRQVDDVIIAAAGGNAPDEQGNANSFPSGQIYGNYTTEIDFSAVTAVNEMFLNNNIDPDEPKVFVIGPVQARKLLHLAQATNKFFTELMQLERGGFIKDWMGFTWVVSTRLLAPISGQRQCFAMTKRAMGLEVSKDIWARIAEDPSLSFAWRIYTAMTMGAVRVEDEHIVQAQFLDTATVSG